MTKPDDEAVIRSAAAAMIEPWMPFLDRVAEFVEAFGGHEAIREVVRRREQGECVAHDAPGVLAVIEYDGDPVCEDCAVDYLREDLDEETADG